MLARIWSESDLLVAECLRDGAWDRLSPADLAAVVSALVYEARRDEQPVDRMPNESVRGALALTVRIWADLVDDEARLSLPATREPDIGLVRAIHRWAAGQSLARALEAAGEGGQELAAGDFIRWCKQLLDLLDQIAAAPPSAGGAPLAGTARAAIAAVRRGVVAQSMQP
jgi:ATP-dependent RNA helicase HelY